MSARLRVAVMSAACFAAGAVAASGQVVEWTAVAPTPIPPNLINTNLQFGDYLTEVGDVDGDGYVDWLTKNINAAGSATGSLNAVGWVGILSGADGTFLQQWTGAIPNEKLTTLGSPGDVDGDGVWDVNLLSMTLTMGTFSGYYSGATGALALGYGTGAAPVGRMLGMHDADLDGVFEHVEIIPFWGGLYYREGVAWPPLTILNAPSISEAVGLDYKMIRDQDGDGLRDVLVGLPGQRCISSNAWYGYAVGRLRVYSSASGAILRDFLGDAVCDRFGLGADAVGDLDGDGIDDFVIAQPGLNAVKSVSGASGAVLASTTWAANCPVGCHFAWIESVGDADGDGVGDFVGVHNPPNTQIYVDLRRASDFAAILPIPSVLVGGAALNTGNYLGSCGDEDGDGFPEILVSNYGPVYGSGSVRRISLRPIGVEPYGVGCGFPGSAAPRIAAGGSLKVGQTLTTSIADVAGPLPVALAIGVSQTSAFGLPLPLDLAALGAPGCALLTSAEIVLPMAAALRPDGTFGATVAIGVPPVPALAGATFAGQWAAFDPTTGAVAVTRGLLATIQP